MHIMKSTIDDDIVCSIIIHCIYAINDFICHYISSHMLEIYSATYVMLHHLILLITKSTTYDMNDYKDEPGYW